MKARDEGVSVVKWEYPLGTPTIIPFLRGKTSCPFHQAMPSQAIFPRFILALTLSCLKLFAVHHPVGINNFHLCVALWTRAGSVAIIGRCTELLWPLSGSHYFTGVISSSAATWITQILKIQSSFPRIPYCSNSLILELIQEQTFTKTVQAQRYHIRCSGGCPKSRKGQNS